MDVAGVFSKLRNTLSSTVNEISSVLPGNPLLREYDAGNQIGSAGPKFLWKIYEGTKKSTKADVAIWVLEKRQLDQYSRSNREMILDIFRKGCIHMTKLKHPRVLTVEHALEESRESIVFCTEPVFASLANILGNRTNISDVSKDLRSYELHEVEIKYGLMQVSEALAFLHGGVKMVHGNLCPQAVIVNKKGAWKLAGFEFCIVNTGSVSSPSFICKDWDTSLPPPALPNPSYLAPECILRKSCNTSSDLFSLGATLYAVYYNGRTLLDCSVQEIYRAMPKHSDKLENLSSSLLEKIPAEVRDHQKMLLSPDPTVRPDADQMSKLPFFEHVGVMTLQYLDTLLQRENLQKSQFFKGLTKILPQLPKRVVMQRVLPSLTSEFANRDMIPFVLPNILFVAEDCTDKEYVDIIFPALIPAFKVQKPIQVFFILLQKMDLLLKKTPADKINSHILPMLASALAAPSVPIQELCLSIIPNFADQLETASMKNNLLPRVRKIVLEGDTTSIRIQGLVCIGKVIQSFDRWFVQDEVLAFLPQIKSREPGILMGILGIYQTTLKSDKLGITKEVMASKSLPYLIPLSMESSLNLKQYSSFMVIIKEMLQRVENEHKTKLEQLSRMQLEQDSALSFTKADSSVPAPASNNPKPVADILSTPLSQPDSDASSAKAHLSLEDKQRLARMKDQERRMKMEGSLQPVNTAKPITPLSQTRTKASPKDLTSSLMQSNLKLMSSPVMSQQQQPTGMMTQGSNYMQMAPPQRMGGGMSLTQPMMTQRASAPQSAMTWHQNTTTNGASNSTFNGVKSSTMFPTYNTGMMTQQSNAMTPQMSVRPQQTTSSSLDNLWNMPSQTKKSLHQMQSTSVAPQRAPMMSPMTNNAFGAQRMPMTPSMPPSFMQPQKMSMSSQGSNQPPTQPLGKQDLLDFLG